ncbi:HAMP domain-containing sensor histidine kinase [Solicola sp. PLA-1-18]|uniref:HAMP domain-containing sensor histidine kinase n=1 Tax=Solicola sp. PLA-1-18 TaxID=3380532 RepID=UPI003B75FFFB
MRRRILALTTGVTALVLVLLAVPLAVVSRQVVVDRSSQETSLVAQSVADYLSTGRFDVPQLRSYLRRQVGRDDVLIAVLLPDGTVVGDRMPAGLPTLRPGDTDRDGDSGRDEDRDGDGPLDTDGDGDGLGAVSPTEQTSVADGRLIQVEATTPSGPALVRAYADDDELTEGVWRWWALIATVSVLLLGLSALAAVLVSRRLVRPLDAAARTASRLSGGDLDARAPVDGPHEVAEVATALNVLAERIDGLMVAERETVADLSHRLRTPLTAVRLGVDALPRDVRSLELSDQVAQLERTLTAVIQAARRPRRSAESGGTDAVATVRERAEFWEPLVQDQGRALTLDLPAVPVSVSCDGSSLAAAVDALLENVVAHTPEGTSMEVRVTTAEEHEDGAVRRWTRVDVLDDGPGFAPSARVRGHSDRGSTGLGLDIAARCAEDVGGRLEIDRDRSRTRVRLVLPAVPMVGPTRT